MHRTGNLRKARPISRNCRVAKLQIRTDECKLKGFARVHIQCNRPRPIDIERRSFVFGAHTAGGAGDEHSIRANEESYQRIYLRPRVLRAGFSIPANLALPHAARLRAASARNGLAG